ncbi:hypothetical protein PAPHI01_1179 [Pancytospora philotis]|nr:hypothetical protein PAPHI01_1179 [Pancytospora philotis]
MQVPMGVKHCLVYPLRAAALLALVWAVLDFPASPSVLRNGEFLEPERALRFTVVTGLLLLCALALRLVAFVCKSAQRVCVGLCLLAFSLSAAEALVFVMLSYADRSEHVNGRFLFHEYSEPIYRQYLIRAASLGTAFLFRDFIGAVPKASVAQLTVAFYTCYYAVAVCLGVAVHDYIGGFTRDCSAPQALALFAGLAYTTLMFGVYIASLQSLAR